MKHPVSDRAGRRVIYENWNYEINVWQVGQAGQLGQIDTPITRTSELWNLYPQISPDGERIAYVSTQSGSHELWLADRDGSNARPVTRASGGVVKSPRWSPDNRRVVYLARGHGALDVHVVDVATGAVSAITSSSVNEIAPAWSHDGARVLFGAPDDRGHWNVWSVDADGARDSRLEIADAMAAQPAPDGTALFFTRPHVSGVWRTPSPVRDATDATRIVDNVDSGNTLGWTVTPDGLYFVEERADVVHLRRVRHDGSDAHDVATLAQFTWPGFSIGPDGRVLYARWDRRESNLMSIEY